jgi:hypothetical protein
MTPAGDPSLSPVRRQPSSGNVRLPTPATCYSSRKAVFHEVTTVLTLFPLRLFKTRRSPLWRHTSHAATSIRPGLQRLEGRVAPALAHVAPLTYRGVAGSASLSNTGQLAFTPTAPGPTTVLDHIGSAFNVDAAGNLWVLESTGALKELTAGPGPRWIARAANVGSFGLSANSVVEALQTTGTLRRFANGKWDPAALATGVTRADVDAAGNIYGLADGNLWKWAPGQTAPTLLNNGTGGTGNQPGNVVSFQVGNNTVAWMLGLQDPFSAKVEVSYASGASPQRVTDNNASGLLAVYAVAADGSVLVADPGAATNTGVTRLAIGQFNVDTSGTDLRVKAVAKAGTSFQLAPDGRAVAVLDGAGGNLSAYAIVANGVGPERDLTTNGSSQSFGIANDLKVYDFQKSGGLRFYDPFAPAPVLTPTPVAPSVKQWQLGPDGEVAFVDPGGQFHVANQTVPNAAQVGFSPNGRLYYLTTSGDLFLGTGRSTNPGGYTFARIGRGAAAFAVGTNGALLSVKRNGDVWRLTGPAANSLGPAVRNANTVYSGYVKLFTGGDVGPAPGSNQAGVGTGTSLFVLPDGDFFFLVGGQFIRLTADHTTILAVGQTSIQWESNPQTEAGVTANVPAFGPSLGAGTFFSAMSTTGFNSLPIALL